MSFLMWEDNRPEPEEYGNFYRDYIDLVDSPNVLQALIQQGQEMFGLIKQLTPKEAAYRYEEDKWSVKEVIGHLIDTERIMATRAMRISRGEDASLPGYDHEKYVEEAHFEDRDLQSLSTEYDTLRNSNISLFNSFDDEQIARSGTANGITISVRALVFIIAGHEQLHLNSLRKKYGIKTSKNS